MNQTQDCRKPDPQEGQQAGRAESAETAMMAGSESHLQAEHCTGAKEAEAMEEVEETAGAESTPQEGQHAEATVAVGATEAERDLRSLPRINWGALLMPAVWGPAHGQWVTVFFYPIWLLADNCLTNAVLHGGIAIVLAAIVVLGTAAVTIFYARTAGYKAYLRVADKMTLQEYLARERIWVVASALIALLFIGLATWYNLAVRLPAGPVA